MILETSTQGNLRAQFGVASSLSLHKALAHSEIAATAPQYQGTSLRVSSRYSATQASCYLQFLTR